MADKLVVRATPGLWEGFLIGERLPAAPTVVVPRLSPAAQQRLIEQIDEPWNKVVSYLFQTDADAKTRTMGITEIKLEQISDDLIYIGVTGDAAFGDQIDGHCIAALQRLQRDFRVSYRMPGGETLEFASVEEMALA
jgi:hypothetical protein